MNKALTFSDARLPIALGNYDALVSFANAYPMISEDEERHLARRLRDHNDLEAAHRLVLSHLRFVIKIARSYLGYGLPVNDVTQEGCIGLMKAVRRFDPEMGVRLASFAVHWIRAEIYNYVLRNWRIVKIATTKAQRKLFFRLRQAKQSLQWLSHQESEQLAAELEVTSSEVRNMEQRLYTSDLCFDAEEAGDDREGSYHLAPAEYLDNPQDNPALLLEYQRDSLRVNQELAQALEQLNDRQRDIIESRWLSEDKATLGDLAERYGVSMERIRQIEKAAIEKLGVAINGALSA